MKKKLKFLFLSLLLLFVLYIAYLFVPFPIFHAGVRYEVIDLGTLPKRNGSMASDINNLGQVVGNSDGHAFFWDPREGMTEILDQAWDLQINDSGVVVGRVNVTSATGWTANKMFIWSATSGTAVFGDPINPPTLREFLIDADSSVYWTQGGPSITDPAKLFRRDPDGSIKEVLEVPPTSSWFFVRRLEAGEDLLICCPSEKIENRYWLLNTEGGIDRISPRLDPPPNFQAIIAGEGEWILGDGTKSDGSWAFHLWNQKQTVRLKSSGRECIVHDVNGSGQCVGASSLESEDRRKASIKRFDRWLDRIPYGETISIALDISKFYRRDHFAFLWQEGEPIHLNTVIARRSPWILKEAIAINDKGEIVGWGYKDGWKHERAFLLRPVQKED